jgi:hypothetical protein
MLRRNERTAESAGRNWCSVVSTKSMVLSLTTREKGTARADLAAVLASVGKNPGQIPSLIRVAGETATALWTLYRAGRALGSPLRAP